MTQDEVRHILSLNPQGIAQSDIADELGMNPSTISKQCRKLERYNETRYEMREDRSKVWFPT